MGQKERHPQDPRMQATNVMWGIVIAITGCSIPLVAMVGSEALALPIFAMLGASVVTGFVWGRKPNPHSVGAISGEQAEQFEMMRQTIYDLHEHMDALERKVEDQALQNRINQASVSTGGGATNAAKPSAPSPSASSTIPTGSSELRFEAPPIATSRKGPSNNS